MGPEVQLVGDGVLVAVAVAQVGIAAQTAVKVVEVDFTRVGRRVALRSLVDIPLRVYVRAAREPSLREEPRQRGREPRVAQEGVAVEARVDVVGGQAGAAAAQLRADVGSHDLREAVDAREFVVGTPADVVVERRSRAVGEAVPDAEFEVDDPGVIALAARQVDFVDGDVAVELATHARLGGPARLAAARARFLGVTPDGTGAGNGDTQGGQQSARAGVYDVTHERRSAGTGGISLNRCRGRLKFGGAPGRAV